MDADSLKSRLEKRGRTVRVVFFLLSETGQRMIKVELS